MFFWECTNFLKQQKQPPEVFRKKGVLKIFAIFTRKHLCWSFFGVFEGNFIKKKLQHRYFAVNITKFLRTPILKNIWEQLHLKQPFLKGVRKNAPGKKAPLPEKCPRENCPPRKMPPGKMLPQENCFTRFLLLLTLSYSFSFSNFL